MKNQKKQKHGGGTYLFPIINNSLVSVIIPTFNRGQLLVKTLNSILEQTLDNFEVIIVDDGSTDKTSQVIKKKFRDHRIKYIKKRHGGQASALNVGIENARGIYICFCDDDDEYLPQKLEKCVTFLENNKLYDACYTAFYFRSPTGKMIIKKYIHNEIFFFEQFFSKGFLFINSMLFKKSIFNKIGNFNETITIGNDYDMLLRILAKGYRIGYIDVPTVIYNKHSSSMTSNKKSMYSVIALLKKNFKDFEDEIYPSFSKKILSNIFFREGKYHFWQKNYLEARKFFMRSIVYDFKNKKPYIFIPFTILGLYFFDQCINAYQKISGNFYIRDCS